MQVPPLAHFTSGPTQSSTFMVHPSVNAVLLLLPSLVAVVVHPRRHTHSIAVVPGPLQGTAFGPHCCSVTTCCLSLYCRSHSSTSKPQLYLKINIIILKLVENLHLYCSYTAVILQLYSPISHRRPRQRSSGHAHFQSATRSTQLPPFKHLGMCVAHSSISI